MITSAETVVVDPSSPINYRKYKKPPALDRGVCQSCDRPIMSYMTLLPGMKLAFVPTYSLGSEVELPEPSFHIHYHSRIEDVNNGVQKFSGGLLSQAACLVPFSLAFFGR